MYLVDILIAKKHLKKYGIRHNKSDRIQRFLIYSVYICKIIKGFTSLPLQDNMHMLRHLMQHFQVASS
jgi:hypothetical protein